MALMSGALLLLAALTVLAAAPVAWAVMAGALRGRGRPFLWPAAMIGLGLAVLVIGGHHFENGWPGTGGHLLVDQGSVPGGVAAFGWSATMWITSYWVHPAALGAFPGTQIGVDGALPGRHRMRGCWLRATPASRTAVTTSVPL